MVNQYHPQILKAEKKYLQIKKVTLKILFSLHEPLEYYFIVVNFLFASQFYYK